jgi:GMP synthase - Glutamine amidotransferase domain
MDKEGFRMRIHYFQHVSFETPGMIADWAESRGHQLTGTHFYQPDAVSPEIRQIDRLIIMGGPMNIYEEQRYPWLRDEKQLIKRALTLRIPVLGICLGAQLLADCLGASVYPGREKEIGWFPVTITAAQENPFHVFPERLNVLHWHGDTFDLPEGAYRTAASKVTPNQAFVYRQRVMGVQFHLEVPEAAIRRLIDHSQEDLVPGPYVQTEKELLGRQTLIDENRRWLYRFLDAWTSPTY